MKELKLMLYYCLSFDILADIPSCRQLCRQSSRFQNDDYNCFMIWLNHVSLYLLWPAPDMTSNVSRTQHPERIYRRNSKKTNTFEWKLWMSSVLVTLVDPAVNRKFSRIRFECGHAQWLPMWSNCWFLWWSGCFICKLTTTQFGLPAVGMKSANCITLISLHFSIIVYLCSLWR